LRPHTDNPKPLSSVARISLLHDGVIQGSLWELTQFISFAGAELTGVQGHMKPLPHPHAPGTCTETRFDTSGRASNHKAMVAGAKPTHL
jgi:hypothetical protein